MCRVWKQLPPISRGGGSTLTAKIFLSPSSATQGHQPFAVFCSKRDTKRSGWKTSSSWSKEHFSAVLAGLGMRWRSNCKAPGTQRPFLAEGFPITGSLGYLAVGQVHGHLLSSWPGFTHGSQSQTLHLSPPTPQIPNHPLIFIPSQPKQSHLNFHHASCLGQVHCIPINYIHSSTGCL